MLRVSGSGFRVSGFGFRIFSVGVRVEGSVMRFQVPTGVQGYLAHKKLSTP